MMKKFLLTGLVIWMSFTGYAQISLDQQDIDELLVSAEGSVEIDTAVAMANLAYISSKSIDYKAGIIRSLEVMSEKYSSVGELTEALRSYLKLVNEAEKASDHMNVLSGEFQIADIYFQGKLYENADEYYSSVIKKEKGMLGNEKTLLAYRRRIECSVNQSDYTQALAKVQLMKLSGLTIDNATRLWLYEVEVGCYKKLDELDKAIEVCKDLLYFTRDKALAKDEITALNNLGYLYKYNARYDLALRHFEEALTLKTETGAPEIEKVPILINMGVVEQNLGSYRKSLEHLNNALNLQKTHGKDKESEARLYDMISVVYLNLSDFYNAQQYNDIAIEMANAHSLNNLLADCYKTKALIYQGDEEYQLALDYYKKYLQLRDSLNLEEKIKQERFLQQQYLVEKSEKEMKLLLAAEEVKDLTIRKLTLEAENKERENSLLRKEKDLAVEISRNKELQAQKSMQELLLVEEKLMARDREKLITELELKEKQQALEIKEQKINEERIISENEILKRDNEIKQLNLDRVRVFRQNAGYIIGLVILIFLGGIFAYINIRRKNRILKIKNQEVEDSHRLVESEKIKNEHLLLNILPAQVATELKDHGKAHPRNYDSASILFTDFQGFTSWASNLAPHEILESLNRYFDAFDEIMEAHGLEKIKTIGDAYMAACGIPDARPDHAERTVKAAIAILEFCRKQATKDSHIGSVRIGIHSGAVVAGVIGKNKFAYDVWGDTVNTASRMETSSEPGKINISHETYELVKHRFSCTYRGEIAVKNKGNVKMYFVNV